MPIALSSPVVRDPITHAEITGFTVDLRSNLMHVRLAELTAGGVVVREIQRSEPVRLLDAEGHPRFTGPEYESIKHAIYRLLIQDGVVAGNVE